MNAIWKFPLTAEETEIEAPIEHFLTVQMQGSVRLGYRKPRQDAAKIQGSNYRYWLGVSTN